MIPLFEYFNMLQSIRKLDKLHTTPSEPTKTAQMGRTTMNDNEITCIRILEAFPVKYPSEYSNKSIEY